MGQADQGTGNLAAAPGKRNPFRCAIMITLRMKSALMEAHTLIYGLEKQVAIFNH